MFSAGKFHLQHVFVTLQYFGLVISLQHTIEFFHVLTKSIEIWFHLLTKSCTALYSDIHAVPILSRIYPQLLLLV